VNDLIGVHQVAGIIGKSEQWVRRLATWGAIKAERVGRTWVFKREDIDIYTRVVSGATSSARDTDTTGTEPVGDAIIQQSE
jgi:hypothetical protein